MDHQAEVETVETPIKIPTYLANIRFNLSKVRVLKRPVVPLVYGDIFETTVTQMFYHYFYSFLATHFLVLKKVFCSLNATYAHLPCRHFCHYCSLVSRIAYLISYLKTCSFQFVVVTPAAYIILLHLTITHH